MRRSSSLPCCFVSLRCSWRRFLYGGRVVSVMCAWSAVSSCFSLPYASFRYWISFESRALGSATGDYPFRFKSSSGARRVPNLLTHSAPFEARSQVRARELAPIRPASRHARRAAARSELERRVDAAPPAERVRGAGGERVARAVGVDAGAGQRPRLPLPRAPLAAGPLAASRARRDGHVARWRLER